MSINFITEMGSSIILGHMKDVGKSAARTLATGAMKEAAAPMQAAIRGGIHDKTGLMKRGTKVRMSKGDRAGRYSVYISSVTTRQTFAKKKPGYRVVAGKGSDRYRIYYSLFVEFGHKIRMAYRMIAGKYGPRKEQGKVAGDVPPHPFVRPGFAATVNQVGQSVEDKLLADAAKAF